MWIWICTIPLAILALLFLILYIRKYFYTKKVMKLVENFRGSIIASVKRLQFDEHYLMMDALTVFMGGFVSYIQLFVDLLSEARRKANDDPMFSYILSLATYYILCTKVSHPSYSLTHQIKNDKIEIEFEDSPNILMTNMGIQLEQYTDGTRLLVETLKTLLEIRYSIINNTSFLYEARKVETIEDAQHLLYKYIDLLPENEFIQILYTVSKELKLSEEELGVLDSEIASRRIWRTDNSILDFLSSIGSVVGIASAVPFVAIGGNGRDEAYFHPLSRLLLTRRKVGLCDYHNMWRASFLIEIARLYGTKCEDTKTACLYFNNASETFEEIANANGDYEKERLNYLKQIKEWAELEAIFSDRIKSLISIGAVQEALLEVQSSKSQKLIAELKAKFLRDIPSALFRQEEDTLEKIDDLDNILSRNPYHFSDSGQPLDLGSKSKSFSWKNLSEERDEYKSKLAQIYNQIQTISPEYLALKDKAVSYTEILKLLSE